MRDIMFIVLLSLSVNKVCGISIISRHQTWNEAFNDSSCSMIGLNLTGDIEENIDDITNSIDTGTVQTAWIGAYARRVWINFKGCFYGKFHLNYKWMTLVPHDDPAKSCFRHCNYSEFVLAEDKCVCSKDVYGSSVGCKPRNCTNTKYRYCGKGADVSNKFPCMCRFSMVNNVNFISGEGNCLLVHYNPVEQLIATDCSYTYQPICYDPSTNRSDINVQSHNWLQSFSECYDNNKQFAGRTANVTGNYTGTYWVGTFAVTYKFWGRPSAAASDSCIAVNKNRYNNKLATVVLPCDTVLPAMCLNSSPSILPTTETNIPHKSHILTSTLQITSTYRASTSIVSATQNSPNTEGNTNRLPSSPSKGPQYRPTGNIQSLISTTVVPAIGIIEYPSTTQTRIPISTTRGPNEGTSKTSSNSLTSTSTTERPVLGTVEASRNTSTPILTIVGPVVGVVVILIVIVVGILLLRRRGMFRKSPATADKTTADLEMKNPGKLDQGGTDEAIHHDVYNHLGEIKTKQQMSDEDLYDHTGGLKYGRLNKNNNQTGNESNYDHTDGTYGRLHADKYRDVCDDMYDHTGDTYGRLHVGKYQDDVDGVYDHTGRLGSTYGHINMVKPEEDCEYDHTRVTHKKTQPEVNSDYDYTRVTHEHRQPKVDSDYDHTFYTP